MSAIYRVSGGVDTIFHGEILGRRYLARNPPKVAISRNISPTYHIVNASQRTVKHATVKSMRYSALKNPFVVEGI